MEGMSSNTTRREVLLVTLILSGAIAGQAGLFGGKGLKPNEVVVELGTTATSDLMVEKGQRVVLSARSQDIAGILPDTSKTAAPRYQWTKDGFTMENALESTLVLTDVSAKDAATYTIFVSGAHGRAESAPVHLSVYTLETNHSNGGTLTVPIGAFNTSSQQVSCSAKTFDRWKAYVPFDGPYTSPQSSTFPNTSQSTNLVISTISTANATSLDTAVKVQNNFLPTTQVACSDDVSSSCGPYLSCSTNAMATGKTYRATIYFKNATLGGQTTVTFSWNYQNY